MPDPIFSICLTVHNKEKILSRVLDGIFENTEWTVSELIVVFDDCTDASFDIFSSKLVHFNGNIRVKSTRLFTPHFETKSNNLAASLAVGKYIIFVQDDMIIKERGWASRLCAPMEANDTLFAISARTAHDWIINPQSRDIATDEFRNDRWSDILIHTNHAHAREQSRDSIQVRMTVNRGPLAINRAHFEKLGGFDEAYAPLSFDEHDLMLRGREIGLLCGSYGIDWETRPEWGGTRTETGQTRGWVYEADFRNARRFYARHKAVLETLHPSKTYYFPEKRDAEATCIVCGTKNVDWTPTDYNVTCWAHKEYSPLPNWELKYRQAGGLLALPERYEKCEICGEPSALHFALPEHSLITCSRHLYLAYSFNLRNALLLAYYNEHVLPADSHPALELPPEWFSGLTPEFKANIAQNYEPRR